MLTVQCDLFAMHSHHTGRIALLQHRIEQYEERIRGLEASRTTHQPEHLLIARDVDALRALLARQLVDEDTLIARPVGARTDRLPDRESDCRDRHRRDAAGDPETGAHAAYGSSRAAE